MTKYSILKKIEEMKRVVVNESYRLVFKHITFLLFLMGAVWHLLGLNIKEALLLLSTNENTGSGVMALSQKPYIR